MIFNATNPTPIPLSRFGQQHSAAHRPMFGENNPGGPSSDKPAGGKNSSPTGADNTPKTESFLDEISKNFQSLKDSVFNNPVSAGVEKAWDIVKNASQWMSVLKEVRPGCNILDRAQGLFNLASARFRQGMLDKGPVADTPEEDAGLKAELQKSVFESYVSLFDKFPLLAVLNNLPGDTNLGEEAVQAAPEQHQERLRSMLGAFKESYEQLTDVESGKNAEQESSPAEESSQDQLQAQLESLSKKIQKVFGEAKAQTIPQDTGAPDSEPATENAATDTTGTSNDPDAREVTDLTVNDILGETPLASQDATDSDEEEGPPPDTKA